MAARAYDAAMLCLRGRAELYYFNFPDKLPDIAAPEGLSRPEIKDKAVRYALRGWQSSESMERGGSCGGDGGGEAVAEKDGGGDDGSGIDEVLPPEFIYSDPLELDDAHWSASGQDYWSDGGDNDRYIFGSIQLWNLD
ncbi:hypothetical protein ZIOFF_063027 [Zingiber officinale]|uniref:AP2/ERF domain-containing protein n=1 Tax=Zingiber officinale TaxID=94328 RepID=A0A8J5K9L2_ZINOF|nr:hypothetical protein ZIOFF_063027 [Zingiber officinale]